MYDRKKTKNGVEAVGGCMRVGGYRRKAVASSKSEKCEKALPTDTHTHGKPPIRVLMYRRNPKNAKKRSPQTDRQTNGKPPIRVLMYDRKKTKNGVEAVGGCMRVGGYRRRAVASSKSEKCEKA